MNKAPSSPDWQTLAHQNVAALLQHWPDLALPLDRHGLGAFCSEDAKNGISRFLRLDTVLRRKGFDPEAFITERLLPALCPDAPANAPAPTNDDPHARDVLRHGGTPGSVLALLPCGMKRSFHAGIREFSEQQPQAYAALDCLIAGNLNYELSYYAHLARAMSEEEMPDLLLAADFNCLFHHDFFRRFTDRGTFAAPSGVPGTGLSRAFTACGYPDPENKYLMITANPLIIVADHAQLAGRPAPRSWADLAGGNWHNEVFIRGDGSFFCNGVLLPLYHMAGMDGIRRLAGAVREGIHPSQMVKQFSERTPGRAPVAIMPYFFAETITGNPDCEIIWPEEGAIISPVFLAARSGSLERVRPLIDYLTGVRFGQILDHAHFPPLREEASSFSPEGRGLYWVGWDFLRSVDSGQLKDEIEKVFVPEFRATL